MLAYIYHALSSFRSVFSRHRTWVLFVMIVLGFLGATEMLGISSFCRFWGLDVQGYYRLLHFFRSTAWCLEDLIHHWVGFVLSQQVAVVMTSRLVVIADHTYVAKDGRRIPGVVTLHQDSETQSKPSYFRGHCWGAIGLLIGSLQAPFCLPLELRLHQGFEHLGPAHTPSRQWTLAERPVAMALAMAMRHAQPIVLILDAYFAVAPVFALAASLWSMAHHVPWVSLMVRAKNNYVAYFPIQAEPEKTRGRPRRYGDKIALMEVFDHRHLFTTVTCQLYGQAEEVSITALDLIWKPTGGLIRFVFAHTRLGPLVLMCSDLQQDPIEALQLYCARVRVEVMFDVLKNLIVAFCYRFWSKCLPRHSRTPKSNDTLQGPAATQAESVRSRWLACEGFVMLGAIAQGLLQLLAVKYPETLWAHFDAFLRTRSRHLPSEATVRHVIARMIRDDFLALRPSATMQEIRHLSPGSASEVEQVGTVFS
jgi:DDE superfamily endonuclease